MVDHIRHAGEGESSPRRLHIAALGLNAWRSLRFSFLRLLIVTIPVVLAACSSPTPFDTVPAPKGDPAPLTAADVVTVVSGAVSAIDSESIAVAVVDREGHILGLFTKPGATVADQEKALSLARTGAFFSNDAAPLSSRTVGMISTPRFPQIVENQSAADLFGIELTNRGCDLSTLGANPYNAGQAVNPSVDLANTTLAREATGLGASDAGASGDGITTTPGGVPLFRNGRVVGGVGVSGTGFDQAHEFAAFSGVSAGGFLPADVPSPGVIFVGGFRLPFVEITTRPEGTSAGVFPGTGAFQAVGDVLAAGATRASPNVALPFAPEGYLIGPMAGNVLTQADVERLVQQSIDQANKTRAAIRLPLGSTTRMVIAVAEATDGAIAQGTLLALFRMPDATVFSIDVAATKSRNVIYFSAADRFALDLPFVPPGTAVTNRTIGFGAQPNFPSGITGAPPGPFQGLLQFDSATPCSQGTDPTDTFPNANESGIVFFPGSTPLYKNGVMVGGLGVSGDGVDQDDVVTAGGAVGFLPADAIRADQIAINDVRLPYFKFSRNPEAL